MRSSASFWLSLILSRISQRSPQDELCGFLCCLVTSARGIQTKEAWNLLAKALNSFRARFSSGDRRGDRGPGSTRNTARPTEISDISAGFTPRRDQARSEMLSLQLVPGRLLARFSVCIHSRACPAELSCGVAESTQLGCAASDDRWFDIQDFTDFTSTQVFYSLALVTARRFWKTAIILSGYWDGREAKF